MSTMKASLPERRTTTVTQQGCVTRKGPHQAKADPKVAATWNKEAAALIDEAIGAMGCESMALYLSEMGGNTVDKTRVSRIRTGAESVALRALLPLLDDENAAPILVAAICKRAGYPMPQKPARVTADQCDRTLAQQVRATVDVFNLYKRRVAEALGTTETDVENAYLEIANK